MKSSLHADDRLAAYSPQDQIACMAFYVRLREVRDLRIGDHLFVFYDIYQRPEAASQHYSDLW